MRDLRWRATKLEITGAARSSSNMGNTTLNLLNSMDAAHHRISFIGCGEKVATDARIGAIESVLEAFPNFATHRDHRPLPGWPAKRA